MKALTFASARKNPGRASRADSAAQKIGGSRGGKVAALRPVGVVAADYAEREYDLSPAQVEEAVERIHRETSAAAAKGDVVTYRPGMLKNAD